MVRWRILSSGEAINILVVAITISLSFLVAASADALTVTFYYIIYPIRDVKTASPCVALPSYLTSTHHAETALHYTAAPSLPCLTFPAETAMTIPPCRASPYLDKTNLDCLTTPSVAEPCPTWILLDCLSLTFLTVPTRTNRASTASPYRALTRPPDHNRPNPSFP